METDFNEWNTIFENIESDCSSDEQIDNEIVIRDFLIKDNINPRLFSANLQYLDVCLIELYEGKIEPTEHISEFAFITSRIPGFPLWFTAAYPDVISWFVEQSKIDEKIFCKATEKDENYFEDKANFVNNLYNNELLRNAISFYLLHSGNSLETSGEAKNIETVSGSIMADSFLPDDLKVLFLESEADELRNRSDFQGAIEKLSKALGIIPDSHIYYKRGEAHYNLRMYNEALNDFNEAIKLNPNFSEAYIGRGSIKVGKFNDIEGGMSDLKRAAELGNQAAIEKYNKVNYHHQRWWL